MPLLAGFVGVLMSGMTSVLGLFFVEQIARRVALVTLIAAGSAALMAVLLAIIPAVSFPSILGTGFYLINGGALSTFIVGVVLTEGAITTHLFTLRIAKAAAGG